MASRVLPSLDSRRSLGILSEAEGRVEGLRHPACPPPAAPHALLRKAKQAGQSVGGPGGAGAPLVPPAKPSAPSGSEEQQSSCSVEKLSAGDAGRGAPRRKLWGMGGQTVGNHGTPAAEAVGLARGRTRCQELFDETQSRK